MIKSESSELKAACDRLASYVSNPSQFLSKVGAYQKQRFASSFERDKSPEGEDWTPLAASTVARKRNRKALVATAGRIPGSLHYAVNGDTLEVGYSHPLAIIHHYGSKRVGRVPEKMRGLFSAGATRPVKGGKLPARTLIGYTDADIQEWENIFEAGVKEVWR